MTDKIFKLTFETYVHCSDIEDAIKLGKELAEKNSTGETLVGVMEIEK